MMNSLSETTRGASPPSRAESSAAAGRAPTELVLSNDLRRELEGVVEASYPFEACGVMIGRPPADGRRVVVEDAFHARNLSVESGRDRFLLDPEDHLAADRVARQRGLEVVGFWHSHPDHPARPSQTDREAAWEGYSYLIVSHPAFGANDFRSWRLQSGRFLEERIRETPLRDPRAGGDR